MTDGQTDRCSYLTLKRMMAHPAQWIVCLCVTKREQPTNWPHDSYPHGSFRSGTDLWVFTKSWRCGLTKFSCKFNFMNFISFSNEISRLFQNQNANYRKLSFDGSNNLSVYILIPRWPGVFTEKTNREIQNWFFHSKKGRRKLSKKGRKKKEEDQKER